MILAAGDDAGRSEIDGGILGVVESHGPASSVVPFGPRVFVHPLPLTPGWIEVAVAVGVRVVVGTENALQGTVDRRIV